MIDGEDEAEQVLGEEIELTEGDEGDDEPPVIGFADDAAEEEADETPLVKRLRDQNRELSRKLAKAHRPATANDDDPEPAIPARKKIEDFDYDGDKFDRHNDEREAAILAHAEWKARESQRDAKRRESDESLSRTVEQQRKALGVTDYEQQSEKVKNALSDTQLAILVNGVENPARMIYALGRSSIRLDQLSSEDNPVKFAVMLGKLEKEIRVTKRTPPPAETKVRGATASTAIGGTDRELQRLEAEADRTGDRSKVIAYNRAKRQQAA